MTVKKILISACLLGRRVRYDGKKLSVEDQTLKDWFDEGWFVSVCPEVDAGMSIPRSPAEILLGDGTQVLQGSSRVMTNTGNDVTRFFLKGASIALDLCLKNQIKVAILSESSPSCGRNTIYNGQFSSTKKKGAGVTAALLQQNGIQVFSQFELTKAFEAAQSL